jgi:uncharacterized delta-60 repeat protein
MVARYNANGSLDTAFGSGGLVDTSLGDFDAAANALVVEPDGTIVAAGHTSTSSGFFNFALIPYNANGSLDTAFGNQGIVLTNFGQFDDQQRHQHHSGPGPLQQRWQPGHEHRDERPGNHRFGRAQPGDPEPGPFALRHAGSSAPSSASSDPFAHKLGDWFQTQVRVLQDNYGSGFMDGAYQ